MMLLLVALVLAEPCDPAEALVALRDTPDAARESYLCLAAHDGARDVLVAALEAPDQEVAPNLTEAQRVAQGPEMARARTTRALTLWLLHHDTVAFDAADVRRLNPADRRLLADGIRARRGRRSPAPAHDAVFSNFSWYQPDPKYTDARLAPLDRANISVADKPPPAPPPPPTIVDELPAEHPEGRGCDGKMASSGAILAVGAALLFGALYASRK